ncbi:MAG: hypothetical protein HKO65_19530 [Gemmatimonadetes bacterium]|nr:hypothetical protein [Gemmatimonadota bacterium]
MNGRLFSFFGAFFLMAIMAGPLLAQEKPPVTSHDLEGKENCLMCHAPEVMPPVPDVPETHEGRAVETCQWCHAADSPMQTTGAKQTSHDLEGKDNCLMCHTAGVMPPAPDAPENHEGRGNETCLWCHTKAGLR